MIKASTTPGSAYAAMMVTGRHGVRMQDDYIHDVAGLVKFAIQRDLTSARNP